MGTSPSAVAAGEGSSQPTPAQSVAGSTLHGVSVPTGPVADAPRHDGLPPDSPQVASGKDEFLVEFARDDPQDPRNWSELKKWTQLCLYLLPEVWAQVISSIFAPGEVNAAHAVGVSEVAMRTVQAIYLYGFAFGPIVVAPGSEDYGRKWILIGSVLMVGLCQIPCALAGSIALMLPFRFVAGFFAAATFNSIGVVGDLWTPEKQGWGVNSFALAAESGAYLGAVIGGFIVQRIGWRWTFGVSGLGMAFIVLVLLCFLRETRSGVLLSRRAAKERKRTGDSRYYSAHEREVQNKTVRAVLTETVGRPIWMLFTEPIVVATALYDGLNYAVIYCIILAFSLLYGETYGWSLEAQNLPFLSAFVGAILGFLCLPLQQKWERRMTARSPNGQLRPEERLAWLVTSPLFPISLFWLAWTAIPQVHWSSSVIAVAAFGFVSHIIFVAISDYTAACYSKYAASSVGAQSLMRELLSGSCTLFILYGYQRVGIPEFGTIVASFAVFVTIVPFGLYWYGPTLRRKSPFCVEQLNAQEEQRLAREKTDDVASDTGSSGRPPFGQGSEAA
ncbi:unnamed protein product [Parajaminaea phylloscopi]